MVSNMPLLLKRSLLSVWSISHPHVLSYMLADQVTAVTESVLQLPGICKKMSYSVLTLQKSFYTPTECFNCISTGTNVL